MEGTLGKRIISHRKRLGMTQDRLAEQLGVTAQAVSKWENDQSCPDITTLPKLAEIFGISVDALLGCAQTETVYEAEVIHNESRENDAAESNGIHIQNGNWELQLDNGRKSSIGMAVWVLLVGSLLLASNLLSWNASFWDILWPSGLLVFGLFGLLPKFSFFRLGCLLFGVYFLLSNLNIAPFIMGKALLLPILLLIFGLSLLTDSLRNPHKRHLSFSHSGENHKRSHCEVRDDTFECTLSFGEVSTVIDTPRLRRGKASISFGELELDLSGCEEIAPGCSIDANCSFGELTILVPRRYRIEAESGSSFGNFETKGTYDPDPVAVIQLDASVSFGEICVKYI